MNSFSIKISPINFGKILEFFFIIYSCSISYSFFSSYLFKEFYLSLMASKKGLTFVHSIFCSLSNYNYSIASKICSKPHLLFSSCQSIFCKISLISTISMFKICFLIYSSPPLMFSLPTWIRFKFNIVANKVTPRLKTSDYS
jgi:hypothetical protein